MNCFALVNIIQNFSVFALSIILVILFKMNVTGAVLGFVVPTIFVSLFSLYFIKDFFEVPSKLFDTVSRELSWFGFYVVLTNSVGLILVQIGSLLIGYFMDETEVGYYAVAVVLVQGITLLPGAIQRVTTPAIATYHGKGEYESIRELIKKVMLKTLIYAFTISVGGALSSIGKVNIAFRIDALCALINIILNILLIPKFGIVGAASATSISLIITVAMVLAFLKRYIFK